MQFVPYFVHLGFLCQLPLCPVIFKSLFLWSSVALSLPLPLYYIIYIHSWTNFIIMGHFSTSLLFYFLILVFLLHLLYNLLCLWIMLIWYILLISSICVLGYMGIFIFSIILLDLYLLHFALFIALLCLLLVLIIFFIIVSSLYVFCQSLIPLCGPF